MKLRRNCRSAIFAIILLPFLAWGQRPTTDNPPLKYDPTTGAFVPSTTNGHTIGPDLSSYQAKAGVLALGGFSSITGTLPVANGGTGITSFGSGIATWLGTPSVANLKLALADETTVVGNLLSLANPSAISFIKIAADNTVSTRTPAEVLTDIGAIASSALDTDGTLAANSDAKVASQKAVKTYVDARTGAAGVKVYRALISQNGTTDAPTAIVLENSLGGTVVWTRADVGYYVATLAGAFPAAKTFLLASNQNNDSGFTKFVRDNDNSVEYVTPDGDGELDHASVEILVYP